MSSVRLKMALALCFALPVGCGEVDVEPATDAWTTEDTQLRATLDDTARLAMNGDGSGCLLWVESIDLGHQRVHLGER